MCSSTPKTTPKLSAKTTQNRLLSDESISCSQAMCLRTSTFVVKPMLLISTHWLLWRCDPLDLCSDRPSETQKATFLRAGASSFPLILMFMSTGQKLGFSLVRTGGGRSRFWRRNFAAHADSRYRCNCANAMCDSPGRGQLRALVKHQQRHSGVPSLWSAARWR